MYEMSPFMEAGALIFLPGRGGWKFLFSNELEFYTQYFSSLHPLSVIMKKELSL